MTFWWWVFVGWVVGGLAVGWALGRWFRWLRGDFDRDE